MKYFWVPAALLAALLAASLWNARQVGAEVEPWRGAAASAVEAAERDDWETALEIVRGTRDEWYAHHPYFHIVIAHDELDKVDALFAEAESFAIERDMGEFRAEMSELIVQLGLLVETQQMTVRNVL